MDATLHVLGLVVLFSVCLVAFASLLFGLPGTFGILAAALVYAWATSFAMVQWTTIAWLTALALTAEGIEIVAGGAGAGGARPSRRVIAAALIGGFVGGIIGTPFLLGVGSLLGALAGAFAGAALAVASEGGSMETAFTVGWAALRGRLVGFVIKAAIAAVMLVLLASAAL